jgi:predicted transcriptional regulator of viral defense system
MKERLGRLEAQFFAYAQMRRMRTVSRGDLSGSMLLLTTDQERKLLSRLARAQLIARVRRGLYLVPTRLPLGGAWTPDEILAINTLIADRQGRYQICGPNAFNRYGYDDQVPNRIYAYNNRLSGDRTIAAVNLTLIKVANERLGEIEEQKTADGETAVYSSRSRTLLDAVYDWSRFGSLPRAYDWIRADLRAGRVRPVDLVRITLRYGDVGAVRRIGALLDREGVDERQLRRLEQRLRTPKNPIPWIPGRARRGKVDRRWGIVWNDRA